jgi:hypothetical protein
MTDEQETIRNIIRVARARMTTRQGAEEFVWTEDEVVTAASRKLANLLYRLGRDTASHGQ